MTTQTKNNTGVATCDITKECTLIKLSITKFGGNKKDKGLAEEAAEKHDMSADVVSTTLTVLDKTVTKIVGKIASSARTWLNFNAAVYDDTGWRMIRNTQYEKIRAKLEEFKIEFMKAVEENILAKYEELQESARQKLGHRFDVVGFPSKEDLASRYTFEVKTQLITDPNDVRCSHLPKEAVAAIQSQNNAIVKEHMAKLMEQLEGLAKRVKDTLSDPDAKFKNTIITNIHDMLDVVPALNFEKDPAVDQFARRLKEDLAGFDPEDLRKKPDVRKEAAEKADSMLKDLAKL